MFMPTKRISTPTLERLENTVNEFVKASQTLLESDHKKIDLVYDFLFVGQPAADPPVQPFVSMVQAALISNRKDVDTINSWAGKIAWSVIGLLIGGAGWFIGTTLTHIIR